MNKVGIKTKNPKNDSKIPIMKNKMKSITLLFDAKSQIADI
jgi:hypothetical protein